MKRVNHPSGLQEFLNEHGLKAKKHSSQNFLVDGNIIRKIVSSAGVQAGDYILEIGPGPGALTEEMLSIGANVFAIEKDSQLASALLRLQTEDDRLTVIEKDFLEFSLLDYFKKVLLDGKKLKVVANLPYHITTPIISTLLPLYDLIETMTLMVQKEVAMRFVANKGTKDYSSFTIFIQHFGSVKYCFTVEPTCFYPRPAVQSAVVHFTLQPLEEIPKQESLFQMIRLAFSQRRKMIKSSLKELYPSEKVEHSLKKIGLNPLARPEELSRKDFVRLHLELIF